MAGSDRTDAQTSIEIFLVTKVNNDMKRHIKSFTLDEDGAVTVDWVVLTAAIVGLAVAGVAAARTGVMTLAGNTSSGIADETVE